MRERPGGLPLHYAWLVVVTFVTLVTTAGFRATPGVLIVPLQAAVALLLVFPIVAIVMRDRPRSVGLALFGATEEEPAPERSEHPFRR